MARERAVNAKRGEGSEGVGAGKGKRPRRAPGGGLGQHQPAEDEVRRCQRGGRPERRPGAELGEKAAEGGADDEAHPEGGAHKTEAGRLLGRFRDIRDHRGRRRPGRRRDPADDPSRQQKPEHARERHDHVVEGEDGERDEQHRPPPHPVGKRPHRRAEEKLHRSIGGRENAAPHRRLGQRAAADLAQEIRHHRDDETDSDRVERNRHHNEDQRQRHGPSAVVPPMPSRFGGPPKVGPQKSAPRSLASGARSGWGLFEYLRNEEGPGCAQSVPSARAKTSGSTLPPVATAMTASPRLAPGLKSAAASATAPPGSSTIFRRRKAAAMARKASASVTARPGPASRRSTGNVSSPGAGVRIASAAEPVVRSFESRRPAASERATSSKPSGSTVRTCKPGARASRARAMPAESPPPPQQTSTSAASTPASAACRAISRPAVP